MNKKIKFIAILSAFILSLGTLSSCAKKPFDELEGDSDFANATEDNTSNSDISGDSDSAPIVDESKFPENVFPIFDGSAYAIKVVISDSATATERQVATTLRSQLKKKTNATISQSTDFLKASESYNPDTYEILIGKTNHEEAQSVYRTLDYNNYGIKTIGKKIVFHFATVDEGTELVSLFINALKSNDAKAFWVDKSLSVSQIDSPILTGLPKYPADSLSTVDCADNTSMVVAKSTNLTKFNEYCATLTSQGYTEYSK